MASATTAGAPEADLPTPQGHDGVGNSGTVDSSELSQVGLINLDNTSLAHNVNVIASVCDNNINVLGVQVPVEELLNGVQAPVGSAGEHENEGIATDICGQGGILDNGIGQSN
ncbi:hypothetical protein L6E12_25960 [Actinokineospora sp. PR83]|uniref:hypothetical protein n=1 Tax=Actinokineospora sp. PR83 TaxID=2884908 RepID=UPI001F4548E1|nr:hypothetical protein [Actinokineospora sp. PR83]MCG8919231.1 hypothetical protein [Actinokineospora sp. PR83]